MLSASCKHMQVSEDANAMGRARSHHRVVRPKSARAQHRRTFVKHHDGDDDNDWSHNRYATLSIKNAEKDTGGRITGRLDVMLQMSYSWKVYVQALPPRLTYHYLQPLFSPYEQRRRHERKSESSDGTTERRTPRHEVGREGVRLAPAVRVQTLCPFPQQRHDTGTDEYRTHHEGELLVIVRTVRVEQEISCQQFDEPGVQQDARRQRVQYATHDVGSKASSVVSRTDAQANGDSDGCRKSVSRAQRPWHPLEASWESNGRETRTDPETLEGLMEDDDWVECSELAASRAER